ncbi:alpha-glucosidase precursor [Polyplosphaeria fusca]|uniref:alpha-glucosidase n=1 Tax=Polyplosphaeria fusca TaxID=682080 RepID=A0A9P4QQP2_9PLEO|nr:alpha-glucosidase precursor [Polyplosphaeria fusca]
MFVGHVGVLVALCRLAQGLPSPRWEVPPDPHVAKIFASPQAIANCPGYAASNVVTTDNSITADLTLAGTACNAYSDDIHDLKLLVEYQTDDRLHVHVYDAGLNVFQVQEEILPRPKNEGAKSSSAQLEFDFVEKPFSFSVKRKENGEVLFDTTGTQIVFETQYVRLRTKLPLDPNVYGLGEHSDPFRLPTFNYTRTMWNSESPFIPTNDNLYGSHPVYFEHRGDKGTHGVFLLSSSGMQININRSDTDGQWLEYNTIGGTLDLYFLAGKKAADVSRQYADVVGYSPMYPYWAFGFQQCKYGYWDVNMVAEVVANYSTADIPLEVMWTDIDHMNLRQDFTLDPERFPLAKMRELVTTLHQRDQRYVLILDPGIHRVGNYSTYVRGHEKEVFLKNEDGSDSWAVQWAGIVSWPDWFAPNTQSWWTDEFNRFFNADTGVDIDGVWVDMNEASNFCHTPKCDENELEGNPPPPTNSPRPNTGRPIPGFPGDFQPTPSSRNSIKARNSKPLSSRQFANGTKKGLQNRDWFNPKYNINNHRGNLSDFTIYTNYTNYDGTRQYDTHNFYGHMMAHTTHSSMLSRRPTKRPLVVTRSTFAGTGRKVTHWFGDNASIWDHYRASIRQMLSFVSMHQMPLVGSDVCGFNQDTDEYLCARWAMLGAFQPFYRNHAEISAIFQEFYRWDLTAAAARKAIAARYQLMDYAYTALYRQTTTGAPMINPLFFLYPGDPATFAIQHQWFYGDALLVSPVTTDYSDTVTFYLPDATFYDFWTHARIEGQAQNVTRTNVSYTDIPLHIRGGAILPMRVESANTTTALRKKDFSILVAPGRDGMAQGSLYLDDGESIEQGGVSDVQFSFDGTKFEAKGEFGYEGKNGESVTVSEIVFLGLKSGSYNGTAGQVVKKGAWKLTGGFTVEV